MKKMLKMISDILFYLISILMIAICVQVVSSKVKGEQPSILGYKFFTVLTGSMEPTISPGDLIIVKEVEPSEIKENDVITFKSFSGKNIVTHRIKEIKNDNGLEFVTQGDANNVADTNTVKERDVIGEVTSHIDGIGNIFVFINRNILNILSVVIIVITFRICTGLICKQKKIKL